ncbi:MAG: cytochrome c peroxidase [Bacteroidota bacterium]
MKVNNLIKILSLLLIFTACKKDPETSSVTALDTALEEALLAASDGMGKSHFMLPYSTELDKIPQDPNNPLNEDKIQLGALLFHETGLALAPKHVEGTGSYSCASCHFATAGFQAGRHQGIADGGMGFGINGESRVPNPTYDLTELDVQPVRSPSALNSAYQKVNLWNGQFGATGPNAGTEAQWTPDTPKETNNLGFEGVETQAIAAMGVHRLDISREICLDLRYHELFDDAFPEVPESERYSTVQAGLAIAAYERFLLPSQAPFQLWLRGSAGVLSDQEKEGAILFFGKAGCANCHNGPNLANMDFHGLGMKDLFETNELTYGADADSDANLGRYSFTKVEADKYKFKVPQLYNLADSPFYGHGSSFRSIREVVAYKNAGVKENPNVPDEQLAEDFQPLGLTESEIDAITAFIEEGLRDPNLLRYQPLSIRSGNCFPNNDEMSKADLGCN